MSHYAPPGSADDRNRRCEVLVDGAVNIQRAAATAAPAVAPTPSAGSLKRVRAFVRTRPSQHFSHDLLQIRKEPGLEAISVMRPRHPDAAHFLRDETIQYEFQVDGVLHNASQGEVFASVCEPVMKNALGGCSGSIICYGQVGSGKSYTVAGSLESFDERGLVPRALSQAFGEEHDVPENEFKFHVSYLELYNDTVHDLLSGMATAKDGDVGKLALKKLSLSEDGFGIMTAKGLTVRHVTSVDDALNCLFEGDVYRAKAPHKLNDVSSRSHVVFTIYVQRRSHVDTDRKGWTFSRMDFVDLAGHERPSKTQPSVKIQQEAAYINKALTFLEQTVKALVCPDKTPYPPFRQSKLSHLLKHCLGGQCQTVVLANVRTEAEHVADSLSSLQFMERSISVPVDSHPVFQEGVDVVLRKQELEIELLREELAAQSILFGNTDATHEAFTQTEVERLREKAMDFLETGDPATIKIDSLRQVRELFQQFRRLHMEQAEELTGKIEEMRNYSATSLSTSHLTSATSDLPATPVTKETGQEGKPSAATLDSRPGRGGAGKKSFKAAATSLKGKKAVESAKEEVQDNRVGNLDPARDGIAIRSKKSQPPADQDFAFASKLQQGETRTLAMKAAALEASRTSLGTTEPTNLVSIAVSRDTPGSMPGALSMESVASGSPAQSSTALQDASHSSSTLLSNTTSGGVRSKTAVVLGQYLRDCDGRPSKEEVFEWFKSTHGFGKELNAEFVKAKQDHRDQAIVVRNEALALYKLKDAIAEITKCLTAGRRRAALDAITGIPELEDRKDLSSMVVSAPQQLIDEISALYKGGLGTLARHRSEMASLKLIVQDGRRSLISQFESMYHDCFVMGKEWTRPAPVNTTSAVEEEVSPRGGSKASLSFTAIAEVAEDDEVEDLTEVESFGAVDVGLDTLPGRMAPERDVLFAEPHPDPRVHARTAFNNARIRARKRENEILRKTGRKPGAIVKSKTPPTSTLRTLDPSERLERKVR